MNERTILNRAKGEGFLQSIWKHLVVILLPLLLTSMAMARENKFLIIHLDAISSVDFFRELEAGSLPNIAGVFADGQQVRYGLTLYPGGTEIIYPRLKAGLDNSTHHSVGWGYLDRDTGRKIGDIPIFLDMFSGFTRHNRHQFLLGIPGFHHLAGLSLLNLERLWETHDVVEFFWFNTDVMGHLSGNKAHLTSLKTFDYYLGMLHRSGKLDGANIVLYSDHGMTTENIQVVPHHKLIPAVLGDQLLHFAYPNVYLKDPSQRYSLAQELVTTTELDLTLVSLGQERIRGYFSGGYFEITRQGPKYKYQYWEQDYFGYDALGYSGEFLSKEDWLRLTKDHLYPAVPPNLFGYLNNPYVGDIVTVLNTPKIPYAIRAQKGNHAGLKNTDLLVPLLYAGPAFAEMEPFEEFWLHELYTENLPMIDFAQKPDRENYSISLAYPLASQVVLSPGYRWRLGLDLSLDKIEPWVQYDIYRSFLSRVWLGAGWHGKLQSHLEIEGFLGDFSLVWRKRYGEASKTQVRWRLAEQVKLKVSKDSVGLTFLF